MTYRPNVPFASGPSADSADGGNPRSPYEPLPPLPRQQQPQQQPVHEPSPHGPGQNRRRKVRRRRRVALRWLAILVVGAILATAGYAFYNYQHFVGGVTHVDAITNASAGSDADGENILLVGDDHRPDNATAEQLAQIGTEQDGGSTSTDTMIVLHVPADGGTATMISFPRDSWVAIPGFGKNKLNAAFEFGSRDGGGASGGAQLLIETIQDMTGISIDHYVRVSMLGFYNVVDALGPVTVCLNNAVKDPYSTVDLPAGVSTLNAQQALAFVRQRHGLPNGDLDRQVRQQYFLSVEARKILSAGTLLNPGKLRKVLDSVSSSIETDPDLNFLDLAARLQGVGADNIASATIPISGTPTITVGRSEVSIVEVDTAAMPAFINGIMGTSTDYSEATAAAPGDVTVTVQNGGTVNGAAAVLTAELAAQGFQTTAPTSTDSTTVSAILCAPGQEAAAKAVAAVLPGATITETAGHTGITVVIGENGLEVVAPAAAAPAAPTGSGGATTEEPLGPLSDSAVDNSGEATTYAAGACIN
ncbi:MAG: LytR family transcriptional regulator [Glaciihabitans sp.]|nr:LytR family transcriptional regulator [Glaciihabitans sp.]